MLLLTLLTLLTACAPVNGLKLCPSGWCDTAAPDTSTPADTAAHETDTPKETGTPPDTAPPDTAPPWDPNAPLELCINELMPDNETALADEGGRIGDWIELHNPGATDVVLAGWSLTDDGTDPTKSPLEGLEAIPAGGYILLWADNDPTLGPTHLGFKLPSEGGQVGLYAPDGRGSLLAFGDTSSDIALYRTTDCCTAAGCWDHAYAGTPGATNTPAETVVETILSAGQSWRYWDQGSLPAVDWASPTYDDSAWPEGAGPLGYGDAHIVTTLSYGANPSAKSITTWFRLSFTVDDPTRYQTLSAAILRDDGAIVSLNGVEVVRTNMPAGVVDASTLASGSIGNETAYAAYVVPPSALVAGVNVFAVELHQASVDSSDLGFDLTLRGELRP